MEVQPFHIVPLEMVEDVGATHGMMLHPLAEVAPQEQAGAAGAAG